MRTADLVGLVRSSLGAQRLRSVLTALGIAIGVAAVVLLTSIGEGVHRFVLSEFTQFGTTVLSVNPGRVTTHGAPMGMFGTTRPLSLADAEALRRVPYAEAVVPIVFGNAEIEAGGRKRRTTIYGVGADLPVAFNFPVAVGEFLPPEDLFAPRALAVLGSTTARELFGSESPLGQPIRVGGVRFRVVGTMQDRGQVLGFDLDDTVYIPAARAMQLFDRDGLVEIDVRYSESAPADEVLRGVERVLEARHGQKDFTVTSQQQMLDVLGNVLGMLTFAVAALGGISLLVGGVGILTIMTIVVRERTAEIGLLRAIGAGRGQVLALFLLDAVVLAALGGVAGLVVGVAGGQVLHLVVPALPVHTPLTFVVIAEAIAVAIGLLAGVVPAYRASRLDPVEALRAE